MPEDALTGLGIPEGNIFEEKIFGAVKSDDRPLFAKLLRILHLGHEQVGLELVRLVRSTLYTPAVRQNFRQQGIAITIQEVGTARDEMKESLTMILLPSLCRVRTRPHH